MKASDLRDELKHIRLIHFTLTTLSGVMLYLIIAAWSVPPQIYAELLDLKDFLGRRQTGKVALREFDSNEADKAEDRMLRSLQKLISPKLQWGWPYKPPFTCVGTAGEYDLLKDNVSRLIDQAGKPCKLIVPDQFAGNVGELQTWIKEHTQYKLYLVTTEPFIVGLAPTSALPGANTGKVSVHINHRYASDGELPPSVAGAYSDEQDFELRMMMIPQSYDPSDHWLRRRFPDVVSYRDVIGNKPLDEAIAWARDQRTKEINSLKPMILGVDVKSGHIGAVGPLVITAMLLYMLAYLRHWLKIMPEEAKTVEESLTSVSPWLGAQNFMGLVITGVSVACLPAVAIMLSLHRLLGWPLLLSVLSGLLSFSIGALCTRSGYQLGGRKVDCT